MLKVTLVVILALLKIPFNLAVGSDVESLLYYCSADMGETGEASFGL